MTYPNPGLFKASPLRNSNIKLINSLDAAIKNLSSERSKQGSTLNNRCEVSYIEDNVLLYLKRTKNQLDLRSDDGKQLNSFINKLERRVGAYQAVLNKKSSSQYELTQYRRFVILLKKCLEKEAASDVFEAEIKNYFNPRDYVTIAHDTFNPTDDYIENNSKQKIATVSLGLSIMAIGAAAIAFCPFLAPIALSIGLLITACAVLSLLTQKQPDNEKITAEEKELFKAAYHLAHSEPETDEEDQFAAQAANL